MATASTRKARTRKATAKSRKSTTRGKSPAAVSHDTGRHDTVRHDNVRNVFLAGLGLYGRAFEEAQAQIKENRSKLEQRREKANELFEELVKRGEQVETDTRRKLKELDLPELKIPELKLADREQLREELRTRLDKARASFDTLRDAVSAKSDAA
jgi:hypothetical protein